MTHPPPVLSRTYPRRARVLLVDDERPLLRAIVRILRLHRPDVEVYCASSATDAVEVLRSLSMDVIVTDLSMPDVDGVTLLEFVRERYPLCFRIIHSSQVGTTLDVDVSELAHRVLPKPAQIDALLDAVDAAVGRMPRRNGGSATSAGA